MGSVSQMNIFPVGGLWMRGGWGWRVFDDDKEGGRWEVLRMR